ncbi:MAG: glycosyltransferase, partial [Pseudomonadota bacterium]
YLSVADGAQMTRALRSLRGDREMSAAMVNTGLETIRERHTCRHRAEQLVGIVADIRGSGLQSQSQHDIGAVA